MAAFSPMCWRRPDKANHRCSIVLNAAAEEIAFTLPRMTEYKNWQQVLNTTEAGADGHRLRIGRRNQSAAALGACLCGRGMNDRQFGPCLASYGTTVSAVGAGGETRRCACWSNRTR